MTPELLAADIARRVPDMAMDSVINNEALISNLMQEYLQHIENRAAFDRVAPFINWCEPQHSPVKQEPRILSKYCEYSDQKPYIPSPESQLDNSPYIDKLFP